MAVNDELNVMNNIDEHIQSISHKYREKCTDCVRYLIELRQLKEDLLDNESQLMGKIEVSYDRAIRQLKNQKERCMSAVSDEYSNRTKHVQSLIDTLEAIQSNLSEYAVMCCQDNFSDTESIGSAVFSDIESITSELPSPVSGPVRVERDINSYEETKFVFGNNGVKEGEFRNLRGIAVDYQNRIFVVDCGNKRVQVCIHTYNGLKLVRLTGQY